MWRHIFKWKSCNARHLLCQGYFHRSSWCGEEQPAASQKPQEQDRESSPYFHSVLQGTLLQLPQEFLKANQPRIMYFSSNLKLVNFIFCIFYNSLQLAHLPTEKAKTLAT